jgi:hypothetical protein
MSRGRHHEGVIPVRYEHEGRRCKGVTRVSQGRHEKVTLASRASYAGSILCCHCHAGEGRSGGVMEGRGLCRVVQLSLSTCLSYTDPQTRAHAAHPSIFSFPAACRVTFGPG